MGSARIGAVLPLLSAIIIALIVGLFLRFHNRLHNYTARVYHLKDGRYCYKQRDTVTNADTWYWLCNSDSGPYYTGSQPLASRVPPGTVWQSSAGRANLQSRPNGEEEEEIAEEDTGKASGVTEEEIAENSSEEPATVDEGGDSGGGHDGGGGGGGGDD
jgi:hypothetical protein